MRSRTDEDYERHGAPDSASDTTGWCADCGQACHGTEINTGIGHYEFWGYSGVDRRISIVSNCCRANILEHDPNEIEEEKPETAH